MFGHDHTEQLNIVTNVKNNQQRIGLQLMGGSGTTFQKTNPAFTVINIDEEHFIPTNFETHFFNITKASLEPKNAGWEYLHDFKKDFNLLDMSPDEIFRGIAKRVLNEEPIAKMYYWNKYQMSPET